MTTTVDVEADSGTDLRRPRNHDDDHHQSPAQRQERHRNRARRGLLVLRLFATTHAIAVFGQPVFAGSFLSGRYDMLALHATGADVVTTLGYVQLVVAVVLWALGGPRWPTAAAVLLVLAETGQYFAGLEGVLDLHVPLGVAVVAGVVVTTVALWRPQDRGVAEVAR